jgi:2-polyprenyl-6-methoxyphenol hydroxylase-like FAD-dependent oxidoreductase
LKSLLKLTICADAAHAVTPALGQGANLAFEDGLELALQLSSASNLRFSFITHLLIFYMAKATSLMMSECGIVL